MLVDGVAALYLERGGSTLQTLARADDPAVADGGGPRPRPRSSRTGRARELVIRKVDGVPVAESPFRDQLCSTPGSVAGYRGLTLRGAR